MRFRRWSGALAAIFLLVSWTPAEEASTRAPGPGYFATDNVEWLANIPLNTDSAGARILDGYLYVTEDRGLTIYDISDPELPVPVGFTPVPQMPYYTEEDVDTNGDILLIGSYGDVTDGTPVNFVSVVDVSNKSLPSVIGRVNGADNHTISCILDCTWAYGSSGAIVDLRDPANPVLLENEWTDGLPAGSSHDVTEVAPGLVMTSSRPVMYLDARSDPAHPEVIATGTPGDNRFVHGNLWPHEGTDKFVLVGGETGGDCNTEDAGAFMVFKPERDLETNEVTSFTMTDEYRLDLGLPTEGRSVYDQYCAHWFSTHPTYQDGGLVAMGWYEHGTRFLDVSDEGTITEVGYFLPVGGSTSAAYWVNDEILYSVDYQRGIDILRYTGAPATSREGRAFSSPAGFHPVAPKLPTRLLYDGPKRREAFVCPLPA
jgi:LVIVD repeat